MDFHKLKLDAFRDVQYRGLPEGVEPPTANAAGRFDCLVCFVQTEAEVADAIESTLGAGSGTGLVLAYPKGTSKKYESEVNRDTIVAQIRSSGRFKAPRLVSLDADWSGFSFRVA